MRNPKPSRAKANVAATVLVVPVNASSGASDSGRTSDSGAAAAVSVKEAAEACQVNLKTIRRRRDKGDFPNSYRSATRASSPWLIPVTDPIAVGLTPGKPAAEEPAPDRETLLVRVWSVVGAPTMTASRWAQFCER